MDKAAFPIGKYLLPDGRSFVALDDFQLRAAAREAWRRQQIADASLALKLAGMPRPSPVVPEPPRFTTGDLFGGPPLRRD